MDWAQVNLFFLILSRMSGFVLFNPIFGRQNVPGIVKSGLVLLLSITVFPVTTYRPAVPESIGAGDGLPAGDGDQPVFLHPPAGG